VDIIAVTRSTAGCERLEVSLVIMLRLTYIVLLSKIKNISFLLISYTHHRKEATTEDAAVLGK